MSLSPFHNQQYLQGQGEAFVGCSAPFDRFAVMCQERGAAEEMAGHLSEIEAHSGLPPNRLSAPRRLGLWVNMVPDTVRPLGKW